MTVTETVPDKVPEPVATVHQPHPGLVFQGAPCWYLTTAIEFQPAYFQHWEPDCRALIVDAIDGTPRSVPRSCVAFRPTKPEIPTRESQTP